MKQVILSIFSALSLGLATTALASEANMALLKKNNCLGCHQIQDAKVGPPYLDVAKKYKGDAGAASRLEYKVAHGGNGVWGTMPMPANSPRVNAKDIKLMVAFILSLAD